ncbi:MAG: hypothetical protein HY719_16625, partial [Planctomycetes bacterium]|nr:hypothetical protein [Planctomycetota bacterium]
TYRDRRGRQRLSPRDLEDPPDRSDARPASPPVNGGRGRSSATSAGVSREAAPVETGTAAPVAGADGSLARFHDEMARQSQELARLRTEFDSQKSRRLEERDIRATASEVATAREMAEGASRRVSGLERELARTRARLRGLFVVALLQTALIVTLALVLPSWSRPEADADPKPAPGASSGNQPPVVSRLQAPGAPSASGDTQEAAHRQMVGGATRAEPAVAERPAPAKPVSAASAPDYRAPTIRMLLRRGGDQEIVMGVRGIASEPRLVASAAEYAPALVAESGAHVALIAFERDEAGARSFLDTRPVVSHDGEPLPARPYQPAAPGLELLHLLVSSPAALDLTDLDAWFTAIRNQSGERWSALLPALRLGIAPLETREYAVSSVWVRVKEAALSAPARAPAPAPPAVLTPPAAPTLRLLYTDPEERETPVAGAPAVPVEPAAIPGRAWYRVAVTPATEGSLLLYRFWRDDSGRLVSKRVAPDEEDFAQAAPPRRRAGEPLLAPDYETTGVTSLNEPVQQGDVLWVAVLVAVSPDRDPPLDRWDHWRSELARALEKEGSFARAERPAAAAAEREFGPAGEAPAPAWRLLFAWVRAP